MNNETEEKSTNFAELVNNLEEAKGAIPFSEEKLKRVKKPQENYLILKDGTVAEMDKGGHDGRVTIQE